MEKKFLQYLRDPKDGSELTYHGIEENGENIVNGILVNSHTLTAYPIMEGVPIMLPSMFAKSFLEKFKDELNAINANYGNKIAIGQSDFNWSFSAEWESHFENNMDTTWGWKVEDRYEQFLLETETDRNEVNQKIVMDAGCGNGDLTKFISRNAKMALGIDLSNSVFLAEKNREDKNVCFIKGDLQAPPVADESIDIIVSNGVIHHTPNTKNTFNSLAKKVAQNGKFYIWLYSQKGNLSWRIKRKFFDLSRAIVCRMNSKMQDFFVSLFVAVLGMFHKDKSKDYLRISMYDSITPRWRHYHTPEEVAHWYYEAGFGPIVLTHFDNKYGFGVYASKKQMDKTPGDHFGK